MDKVACDLFKENVKNNWFDLTVTWNVKFDVFFYFEVDLTFKNLTFDVANHSDVDAWRMRKSHDMKLTSRSLPTPCHKWFVKAVQSLPSQLGTPSYVRSSLTFFSRFSFSSFFTPSNPCRSEFYPIYQNTRQFQNSRHRSSIRSSSTNTSLQI